MGSLGGFGLPTLVLRKVAVLTASGQTKRAQQFWQQSLLTAATISGTLALLAHLFRNSLAQILLNDSSLGYIVSFATWSAVPFVLIALLAMTLNAQKHPNIGLSLQFGLVPAFLLVCTGYFHFAGKPLSVTSVLIAYALSLVLTAVLAAIVVQYTSASRKPANASATNGLAQNWPTNSSAFLAGKVWAKAKSYFGTTPQLQKVMPQAFRFWLIGLLGQAMGNAPFVLLPYFSTQEQIGLFGVAHRLISLAVPILLAISSIYAPLFASAYAQRNGTSLRSLLRQTQLYSIAAYLPLLIVFLSRSNWVLGFFGDQFMAARPYLLILAFGQLVNSAAGLVTFFNLMTENEQFEVKASAVALTSTVTFSAVIAQAYGAMGVAVAVAFSLALKNTLSYIKALRTIEALGGSR